jgi:hypothetical protein
MTTTTVIPAATYTDVYVMDPETEDLLLGEELADGMVVLIESESCRAGVIPGMVEPATALVGGRWCRIEKLRTAPSFGLPMVAFIGVYEDGSKFTRRYGTSHSWYVKLSSIPAVSA